MWFWLGFAAGLVVEGLALWALVAWHEYRERKELERPFDTDARHMQERQQ